MPFSDLQIFHPLAVAGLEIRTDTLPRPLTLPHNLTPADKERLVALLLSSLRDGGVHPGNLIRLAWRNRAWLNSAEPPSILCRSDDALWLIVEEPVESAELFRFVDDCDCLTLIDLRYPSEDEHVQWLAVLKNAMLDAIQSWWRRFVQHDEADEVNFTAVRRWFESPIDALDYCNTIAAGLFDGHSLVYVERQTMAAILSGKAQSLSVESVVALVGFALRERWEHLRFHQPKPLPDFGSHFVEWQAAGLGWLAGDEFVPLPAIERLRERETLEPFFAHWNREREENAALHQFWDGLRAALTPPESHVSAPQLRGADSPLRPAENLIAGTCGTPTEIREEIVRHFPNLAPDADDTILQVALARETDADRRLLLSAWRASLWLDKAADRSIPPAESLRAENGTARIIEIVWNQLNLHAAPDTLSFAAAESWARLRAALADHLTERSRLGETTKLITLAGAHLSEALAVFRSLKLRQQEANVLQAMGDLLMRVADLSGARASYEKALPIYREIEARLGEANVLKAMGDLLMRVDDLSGARASYEKALPIYREIEARLGEANVLKAMGDLLMRVADLSGARASYEKALPIYREIEARLGEANVLQAMGDLLMRVDDLSGARASYEKALPIYREIEARLGEANVLQAMGDLLMRVDDLSGARASYEKALPIYREIEARLGEANVLRAMGDLLMRVADLSGARASYEKALPIYREIEDRLGEANVLQAMGDLLMRVADLSGARASYEKALPIYREIEDRLGEANVLRAMGDLLMRVDDLSGARASYEKALPIYREIEDRLGEANVLKAMGDLLMRVADLSGARASYEKALPIYREIEDRLGEANVLRAMGDLLMRVADLSGARASYEKALPIYREIEARLGEANVLASLGRLALAEGNEDEADRLLEMATAINQAIGERFNPALDSAKYGLALKDIGKKEKARLHLLRAAELFAAIGFDDYAETCRAEAEESDEEEN